MAKGQMLKDILTKYYNSTSKTYEDVVTKISTLKREISIGDVEFEVAEIVDTLIRLWNDYDETNSIPVEDRIPIRIYIDSDGGYTQAAFTIIDSIRLSKTPVYTYNIGKAYSSGLIIFTCGHKRFSYPNASFLFHEGSIQLGGDAGKFKNGADFYKVTLNQMKNIFLEETHLTEEEYELHTKDDWWFTAEEAIEKGFCDAYCTASRDEEYDDL